MGSSSKHETTSLKKNRESYSGLKTKNKKQKQKGQVHFSFSKKEEGEKHFHRYKLNQIAQTYSDSQLLLEFGVETERCYLS